MIWWNSLTPDEKRRKALQNALRQGEQTGDYSAYSMLAQQQMSPERKKQQALENATAQYRRDNGGLAR
jgi:hypothetical protein